MFFYSYNYSINNKFFEYKSAYYDSYQWLVKNKIKENM